MTNEKARKASELIDDAEYAIMSAISTFNVTCRAKGYEYETNLRGWEEGLNCKETLSELRNKLEELGAEVEKFEDGKYDDKNEDTKMKTIKYAEMTDRQYNGYDSYDFSGDNVIKEEVGDEYTLADLVFDNVHGTIEQIDDKTFRVTDEFDVVTYIVDLTD